MVQRDDYLAHLTHDGGRIADLARGNLDAPVPTCPEWSLRDLVVHTGFVHRWFSAATRERTDGPPEFPSQAPPEDGDALAEWLRSGVDDLVTVLRDLDADTPRWTWFTPDQTAGWYFRRAAQETLVHRIDAELAAGAVTDVDAELAVDGIDEMCDVFIPASNGRPIGGDGKTLHLHATDAAGEWLLTLRADGVDVARGHAKGDAALRAAARDLLLLVWGRDPLGEVEHFGDEAVITTFRAAAKIA